MSGGRHLGPHRPRVHAQHDALDLRHLGAGQRHRPSGVKSGGDSWFFLTADYAFGHALERDTAAVVEARRQGARQGAPSLPRHGLLLLPAAGPGLRRQGHRHWPTPAATPINAIKQAAEFGITAAARARRPAGVHHRRARARPEAAKAWCYGGFYWDLNDATRNVRPRFASRVRRQVADHGSRRRLFLGAHYLKAVADWSRTRSGATVVAQDEGDAHRRQLFGKGSIRADGRKIHPTVPVPGEAAGRSRSTLGLLQAVATIPADEAFRPLAEGGCPLVR